MKNKFVNINTRRMLWAASVLTALFFSACEVDDREDAAFSEMGVVKGVYEVSPEYGTLEMQIYSNHTCDVYPAETYDWATLMTNKVNGDGSVTVEFQENYSFRRQAKFYVYAAESNRLDSIILRQRGAIDIILNSPTPNVKVYSQSGAVSVPFSTNVNKDDISISIFGETADEPSWVNHDFVLDDINHALNFTVGQNTSETDLRNARILMQYRDAWDSLFVYSIYLIQANAKDEFGQLITFQQARNWAGDKVSSYEYIEGYIISDAGNMNMGDNLQETDTKIDYTVNDKTAYIQSTDGQMGFMILTKDADDNHFLRYSKVQLLLKDATVEKMENPTRYVIRDVTSAMVLESQEGNYSNLPAKEKYMSELTDDDVYTYVTLKDCEFPVRKGSLTPYNEGYTTLFSAHRVNKYPLLMRDIQGNSMFLLTNTTCPYRRDGRMLPYGSGKISGVIVHETFPRFEYEGLGDENEESYGEIGRYEMRHVTREDIQFAEDFSNSFSALLTEYRWPLIKNGIAYPTWPNETGEGNNGTISVSHILTNPAAAIGRSSDFSYLGPCGNNRDGILNGNEGNTNPLGNGVILADGTKQNKEEGTNYEDISTTGPAGTNNGKGVTINASLGYSGLWWNYAENRGEAYIIEFSTQGISTTQLSMQFAMQGLAAGIPHYWKAEWSEDGKWYNTDNTADPNRQLVDWNFIGTFTLPEVVNWTKTLLSQLPGQKYYNFKLPLEMLGKEKVYIRLMVDRNDAGTLNAQNITQTYAGSLISPTANKNCAMGYFAIRYNK